MRILDPQEPFLQKWNKILILSCVMAVSLDPLFFYIPVIDGRRNCLGMDKNLAITTCVLRSFFDMFYILRIIFQFRTGFVAPSSRVFGRGELVKDQRAIAKRYLSSYFIIDILSLLPLPQVALLGVIPKLKGPISMVMKESLMFIVFSQYVPRLIRIYPLYKEVIQNSGIVTETAWAGATSNFCLYMLASHVIGAIWYLLSTERKVRCWQDACWKKKCDSKHLNCGEHHTGDNAFLNASCPLIDPDDIKDLTVFNFGIFLDALQSGVVESRDFHLKFSYCFWWGLRSLRKLQGRKFSNIPIFLIANIVIMTSNLPMVLIASIVIPANGTLVGLWNIFYHLIYPLSSLGQNLKTSTSTGEIYFAVFISAFGLVLFSLLIGNMQKYLQSVDSGTEERRLKRRDLEYWMSHCMLPGDLRERIRRYEQYRWQETRGIDVETMIRNLPKDLRRDLKRYFCLDLLKRVPMFQKMDEQLLDAMCDRLKLHFYTEHSYIAREGDPIDEMLFIMRGRVLTLTPDGGRTGTCFFNTDYLNAGDFYGEVLLTWALDPNSPSMLPTSDSTLKALTEVEIFALKPDDLKFVASQFRQFHSKLAQHTFRFYSQQWRTWAACFIQAAWRQYCWRKHEKSLRAEEDRQQEALAREAGTSSARLGTTIYASMFANNALRTLQHNGARRARLLPQLPKPAEPDFTTKDH